MAKGTKEARWSETIPQPGVHTFSPNEFIAAKKSPSALK